MLSEKFYIMEYVIIIILIGIVSQILITLSCIIIAHKQNNPILNKFVFGAFSMLFLSFIPIVNIIIALWIVGIAIRG